MGVATDGLYFQKLDTGGAPTGSPATIASSYRYVDIALAQSGDGFMVAGVYDLGSDGSGDEIDLFYVDANGAVRDTGLGLFNTGHAIDSLQVVRSNGRRVIVIWRDATVGLRWFRVEPTSSGTTWNITQVGGATLDYLTPSQSLVANGAVLPGVGADSAMNDYASGQTCAAAATLVTVGVAYRTSPTVMKFFTVVENGAKGTDTDMRDVTGSTGRSLVEPDLTYFNNGGAVAWFASWVMQDTTAPAKADLEVWLSNMPGYNWAWLAFAYDNGAASIARPRGSATASRLQVVASRWVADVSGFKKQVMTRRFDFSGNRDPSSSSVEIPVTSGSCGADPACRPGEKHGVTAWAPFGRLYYTAGGSTPVGAFSSALTCQ
jgi:hypothetical protein